METRVAIIGIIVENPDSVSQINDILHEVRDYVVGRMGIPYRERNISIISVVVDAPETDKFSIRQDWHARWRLGQDHLLEIDQWHLMFRAY